MRRGGNAVRLAWKLALGVGVTLPLAFLMFGSERTLPVRDLATVEDYTNLAIPDDTKLDCGELYITLQSGRYLVARVRMTDSGLRRFLDQPTLRGTHNERPEVVSRFIHSLPQHLLARWELQPKDGQKVAGGAFAEAPQVGTLVEPGVVDPRTVYIWSVN